jgi:hypothetical protein
VTSFSLELVEACGIRPGYQAGMLHCPSRESVTELDPWFLLGVETPSPLHCSAGIISGGATPACDRQRPV